MVMEKAIRQKEIRQRLNFDCDCIACVNDFPKLKVYKFIQAYRCVNPMDHNKLLEAFNVEEIKRLIPKYITFLNANAHKYPGTHTVTAEQLLHEFFRLVYRDSVPFSEKIRLQL